MTFSSELNLVNIVLALLLSVIAYFLNRYFKTQDEMNKALFAGISKITDSLINSEKEITELGQWAKSHDKQDDERHLILTTSLDKLK